MYHRNFHANAVTVWDLLTARSACLRVDTDVRFLIGREGEEREKDRQTETEKDKDRQTNRQTDTRETKTERDRDRESICL